MTSIRPEGWIGQEVLTILPAHYMVLTLNRQPAPMQDRTIPLDSAEQQFITSVPDENSQARSNILCASEENLVLNPNTLYDRLLPAHLNYRSHVTPLPSGASTP